MADFKYSGITLIAQVLADDFNVTTDTDLFIVPLDKEFTPFAVCISKASGSMTTATVSFGQSTAKTDFLAAQTLTGINAAGDAVWCRPPGHATVPVGIVTYTEGEKFVMDHVVAQGAAMTADISVFGFLNNA